MKTKLQVLKEVREESFAYRRTLTDYLTVVNDKEAAAELSAVNHFIGTLRDSIYNEKWEEASRGNVPVEAVGGNPYIGQEFNGRCSKTREFDFVQMAGEVRTDVRERATESVE